MQRRRFRPALATAALLALALGACSREAAPPAPTVGTASPADAASASLPVTPSGQTNASKAAEALDRTNSTASMGGSNMPQPPSSAPAPDPTGSAPAGAADQAVSSTSLGTSAPPLANPPQIGQGGTNARGGPAPR